MENTSLKQEFQDKYNLVGECFGECYEAFKTGVGIGISLFSRKNLANKTEEIPEEIKEIISNYIDEKRKERTEVGSLLKGFNTLYDKAFKKSKK